MMAGVLGFFGANGILFELIISVGLFSWHLDRRAWFRWRLTAAVLLMLVVSMLWNAVVPTTTLTLILRCLIWYVMCYCTIRVCFRIDVGLAMFVLAYGCVTQHFAYRGARVLSTRLHLVWEEASWIDTFVYVLALVPFFVLVWFLFARRFARCHRVDTLDRRGISLLFIGFVLCANVLSNLFDSYQTEGFSGGYTVFALFDLVTCVFQLALLREIVNRETAQRDEETLRLLLAQQKSQLASDKETIELINIKTHDLKKQLATLGNRIPREEIDDLTSLVGIYDSTVATGNEALDVLLANRSLVCEQHDIQFDRIVDGALLNFMRPADIYALFGNAIDNAMEAVEPIGDAERRYIRMKVQERKGMAVIHVENPFDGEREFSDGLPQTTKGDRNEHGFGTRSMRMIVERYGGVMTVKAENQMFRLNILLPLPR